MELNATQVSTTLSELQAPHTGWIKWEQEHVSQV